MARGRAAAGRGIGLDGLGGHGLGAWLRPWRPALQPAWPLARPQPSWRPAWLALAGAVLAGAFFAGGLTAGLGHRLLSGRLGRWLGRDLLGRRLRRLGHGFGRLGGRLGLGRGSWQRPWVGTSLPVSSRQRRRRETAKRPPTFLVLVMHRLHECELYPDCRARGAHCWGFHSPRPATDLPKGKAISCRIETIIGTPARVRRKGGKPNVRQGTAPGPAERCPSAGRCR